MGRNKKVKAKEVPKASKIPRAGNVPYDFREMNPTWQLANIDFESKWGLNAVLSKTKFNLSEDLLNFFADGDYHDDLFNACDRLNDCFFESIDDFLLKFSKEAHPEMPVNLLREIIKNLGWRYFEEEIHPKLKNFEAQKWTEIENESIVGKGGARAKHHQMPIDKLSKEAQKRLLDLKLDDVDEIFSLRLTGKIRIWGIRKFNCLQIIWFDLDHSVYPVGK